MTTPLLNFNPANGAVIGEIETTAPDLVAQHARDALAVFDSGAWSGRTPRERAAVLLRLADLMERDAALLARLDSEDAGKPIRECIENDVTGAIETIRWFAEAVDKRYGDVSTTPRNALSFTEWEPFGVVAAILPWNYPLAMAAWKVGPALALGNSLILKPAEATPRSTFHLARLAVEAGLPDGVLRVLTGHGSVTGDSLARDPLIGAISFTGSTTTGRRVLKAAAESNMKRVSLEMGGKSPQILLDDALDFGEDLIQNMVTAAYLTSGQNCTAGSRILVARSIHDEVVRRFVDAAEALVVGDPSDPRTDLGPVISDAAADRILTAVRAAVSNGARLATGGEEVLVSPGGRYLPPTVLTDVPAGDHILRAELFGPVVTVQSFDTLEDAITLANDTDYGLAASIWTSNINDALGAARRVRAGLISINSYSEGDLTVPFSGWNHSGFGGAEKSLAGFEQWSRRKSVWAQITPPQ